jgi:hypothetical protein
MGHDGIQTSCSAQKYDSHFKQHYCMFFCILNAHLLSYIDFQNVYNRGSAWPHKASHLRRTHSSNVGFSVGFPLFFRRFWHCSTLKVIVLDRNLAILTQKVIVLDRNLAILSQKTRLWQRQSWDFRRKIRNLMTSQSLIRGITSTPKTTFYHSQTLCPPEISRKNTPSQNSNSWLWLSASFRRNNQTMRVLILQ